MSAGGHDACRTMSQIPNEGAYMRAHTYAHARAHTYARERELYGKTRHGPACVMASSRSRHVAEGALLDLADRLRRLAPSPRDPEHFHIEKSEIVAALRSIAREVRHG